MNMPALNAENPSLPEQAEIVEAIRKIYDPEIPVNIYDLGLIYRLHVDPA
jgi:metal-sulfur cluster biosynthetic enzyme